MSLPAQLREGYRRFRRGRYRREAARFRELAESQRPGTMIIACSDSRVDPATIFSAAPGEYFIVRNVAALVPPCEATGTYHGTSAAIEFAVMGLNVKSIVVMGHGMCGGVAAALAVADDRPVGQFIRPWVDMLAESRENLLEHAGSLRPEQRQRALERMAIQHSLDNLLTFPFVVDAIERGHLALHGAWFSIAEGQLHWLNRDTGDFELVGATSETG